MARTLWAETALKNLAVNLKTRRKARGLTLQSLARKAGCSFQVIWHIENEHNFPSMSVYLSLCRVLRAGRVPLT